MRLVREDKKACPFCGEQVLAVAKKCKHCGEIIDVVLRAAEDAKRTADSSNPVGAERTIIVTAPKSIGVAILLSFLFGPLGMLYSTVAGGLTMMAVNLLIIVGIPCGLAWPEMFLTWPVCVIWAAIAASRDNAVEQHYVAKNDDEEGTAKSHRRNPEFDVAMGVVLTVVGVIALGWAFSVYNSIEVQLGGLRGQRAENLGIATIGGFMSLVFGLVVLFSRK